MGQDGNAFLIMARVVRAMRRADLSEEKINLYQREAMSRDYDNLLQTTLQ